MGEDGDIERRMKSEHVEVELRLAEMAIDKIYYIYRWGGTGSFHMSALARNEPEQMTVNDKVGEYVARQVAKGEIETGSIELHPKWRRDYATMVREFVEGGGPAQ